MTRDEFKALCENGTVLLDGATGSNLRKKGMPIGVCVEKWITEHPDIIVELQKAYVEAGTKILYAPTFSANRISLEDKGLADELEYLNKELVRISKEAAKGKEVFIAGDLTTTNMPIFNYDEVLDAYKEQIRILDEAGVDLLVAETMLREEEMMAYVDAAKETTDLPIMCSFTVQADGSLYFGGDLYSAAAAMEAMGADAIGLNCSVGPEQLVTVVKNLRACVSIPILVKPNAGMPVMTDKGEAVYSMTEEDFADNMKVLVDMGVNLAGGCCGTTPAYIKALAEAIRG